MNKDKTIIIEPSAAGLRAALDKQLAHSIEKLGPTAHEVSPEGMLSMFAACSDAVATIQQGVAIAMSPLIQVLGPEGYATAVVSTMKEIIAQGEVAGARMMAMQESGPIVAPGDGSVN